MSRKKLHHSRLYHVVGEPGPGARVVGYVRYSSDMQSAASIATQKRRIQALADSKGWIIVMWYEEPEQSAKDEHISKRPQFAALLAAAGVEFDAVLCYDTCRWSRNVAVTKISLAELRRRHVWWQLSEESWTIDNIQQPGLAAGFSLAAQQAEDYLVELSKYTIAALDDRARDGFHLGRQPFGYLPPEYPQSPPHAPSTWRPPRVAVSPDPETFPALVKIGELAAAGWSDSAIADELVGYFSTTPRFGKRALTKDTIAAIRRSWFPREFMPGSGLGTIETPTGERIEGKHPAAWPYETWQRIIQAKQTRYHRRTTEAPRKAHVFSRIAVCAGCLRPLRVQPHPGGYIYYRDTSATRKLPCPTPGNLMINAHLLAQQFGELLASITLSGAWRTAIAERCRADQENRDLEQPKERQITLEAERQRLVNAYIKGYLPERDADERINQIQFELQRLTGPEAVHAQIAEAISAGEALTDMAGHWAIATGQERRDMVWALLQAEGLIYDLERRIIAAILPRPALLPALTLGLESAWERRDGEIDKGIWRRGLEGFSKHTAVKNVPPQTPPALTPEQREQALALMRSGLSQREVAARFPGVSYGAIWRLSQAERRREERQPS
jgi:DNA invertase Pin-like site-specific DNA recombinase